MSNKQNNQTNDSDLDGFQSLRSEKSDAYFRVETGAVIRGILTGRFEKRHGRKGAYYQIQLTAPCEHCQRKVDTEPGQPPEYEDCKAGVGDIVSVDERSAMEGLAKLLGDKNQKWEVYLKFVEKLPMPGTSQSFWNIDVRGKPVKTSEIPF